MGEAEKTDCVRIGVPEQATIPHADAIGDLLKTSLADAGDLLLDCGAIRQADISFIQLVLAARRSAAAQGRKLLLAGPPPRPLLETLALAGLTGASTPSELNDFWHAKGV